MYLFLHIHVYGKGWWCSFIGVPLCIRRLPLKDDENGHVMTQMKKGR